MRTHAAPALAAALLAAALAACVCVLVGLGGTPRPVSLAAAAPIPALLHQVWIGDERRIPKAYHRYSKTWARRNPGMRIMRHTDDRRSRRFVAEHYPRFLPLYDGCERPVEKADLLRYMLVQSLALAGQWAMLASPSPYTWVRVQAPSLSSARFSQ